MRSATLIALLGAVALGLAGCGGGEEVGALPETVVGTVPQATTAGPSTTLKGDAAAGKNLYASKGCGGCHTLAAANSGGVTGPNLDQVLAGQSLATIHESIVDPSKVIAKGFPANVMPANYGEIITPEQLDQLVQYLSESTGGGKGRSKSKGG